MRAGPVRSERLCGLELHGCRRSDRSPSSHRCTNNDSLGSPPNGNEDAHGYELVVRDGEASARVYVHLPWRTPFVNVGDTVSIEHEAQHGPWFVGRGDLKLRDADGELLFWFAQTHDGFGSLSLPELQIRDGAASCMYDDSCGPNVRAGVIASSGDEEVAIPFRGSADVGNFAVLHADNTNFTFTGGCTDSSSFHQVVVAAVRGSLAQLDAPATTSSR